MEASELITIASVLFAGAATIAAFVATQRSNSRVAEHEEAEEKARKEREEDHKKEHEASEKRWQDMVRRLDHTDRNILQAVTFLQVRADFVDEAVMEVIVALPDDVRARIIDRRPDLRRVYVERRPFEPRHNNTTVPKDD